MKLLNLNKIAYIWVIFILLLFNSNAEDVVDIWKKNQNNQNSNQGEKKTKDQKNINKINISNLKEKEKTIEVTDSFNDQNQDKVIYGIYDPDANDFNLNMWSNSDGSEIKEIIKRINRLELSNFAEEIFINTILSYSYLPKGLTDKEFLDIKINWLINNKKDELLEEFLNKNESFYKKKRVIQYLVDKNIAKANLNDGCKKISFIGKDIKDSYLEKFKIYCLVFNDKKNQAQLLYDILKEQKLSDKFFDDKINYLLGITDKTSQKIKDDNLLNFYLSSITIKDFKYEPNEKTKKAIWEYLNSANLIKVDNIEDKEKIKKLEVAANVNTFDKNKIFVIYQTIPFDLNNLINAENVYQTFDSLESRALIYQKYLLSDKVENKIKYLFILKDLFKKDKLSNVYTFFLSQKLKELPADEIPESYQQIVKNNIISETNFKLGKIKFNDKILHKSRVIRYYSEPGTAKQKTQKDLENIYKKIKRNKKYFFSAKDLVLIEALSSDGFKIPADIKYKEISKKYSVPSNLVKLAKDNETGFLALKFVEIIGSDEIKDLDPETIYFITNILNKAKLIKLRNKVLISTLPLRT